MTKKMSKSMEPAATGQVLTGTREGSMFDPWPLMSLSDWFDRWPEMFARRWPESFRGTHFVEEGFRMEQFVEDDGTVVVRGELPGLDVDNDVTITVDDNELTIVGTREERTEDSANGAYRSEFHYGSFRRSVHLPPGAKTDDVEATYTDGILEVRVPVDADAPVVTKVPIVKAS